MPQQSYDFLIVGAGAAGATLAHALSRASAGRYRIALLERSLSEPDRIVGELLQPGGWDILKRLGMGDCVDGIDAVKVHGYSVVKDGDAVRIPYTDDKEGRSFHHGRFIQNLREKVRTAPGVETVEATVTDLIEDAHSGRVVGVRAVRKSNAGGDKEPFVADVVIVADGCFSNFRSAVYRAKPKTTNVGHFVGVILEDAKLPIPRHGTVCLVRGHGPVLLYQIAEHDTRMLVDVKAPLPADLKSHILNEIVPHLPTTLQLPAKHALETDRLRRMPNTFLAPEVQGGRATKEGVILLGDAWNMRHPLTGGGMTVAFHDVEILSRLLPDLHDLKDWDAVSAVLHRWHWERKALAATVNILSVALYDLFGADDEYLSVLRDGCFAYFERGGTCVSEPVGLLSAVRPDTWLLFYHFFSVAFYSIYVMFTRPRPVVGPHSTSEKRRTAPPGIEEYPLLSLKAVRVFWTACVVFGPLLWSEYRWW